LNPFGTDCPNDTSANKRNAQVAIFFIDGVIYNYRFGPQNKLNTAITPPTFAPSQEINVFNIGSAWNPNAVPQSLSIFEAMPLLTFASH
jgi:hypothetical protein